MSKENSPLKASYNRVLFGNEVENKLAAGVKAVHDAVGVTMGPSGERVIFDYGPFPVATKDGVTVAKLLRYSDEAMDNGAQMVIHAAKRQVDSTGDGTTLTCIMAWELYRRALEEKNKKEGSRSRKEILQDLSDFLNKTVTAIRKESIPCDTEKRIEEVALIATNGDVQLAGIIAAAVWKTGIYGIVTHQKAVQPDNTVEYTNGYPVDTGIYAAEFSNMPGQNIMNVFNPYVLTTDRKLTDCRELAPILREILETPEQPIIDTTEKYVPTLIIVSPQMGGDMLPFMLRNNVNPKRQFFIVHILPTTDSRPEKRKMVLEDIAAFTGGVFFKKENGREISDLKLRDLGRCGNVQSGILKTVFVAGVGSSINERITKLKDIKRSQKENIYITELINMSVAKLLGGTALIKIGGQNLIEQAETMYRVDDAIHACKSALEEGVVRGWGVAMCKAIEKKGYLDESLAYPLKIISRNKGIPVAETMKWIDFLVDGRTDPETQKVLPEDMFMVGIIDPTKVIVHALKNAVSVVRSLLSCSTMVVTDTLRDEYDIDKED